MRKKNARDLFTRCSMPFIARKHSKHKTFPLENDDAEEPRTHTYTHMRVRTHRGKETHIVLIDLKGLRHQGRTRGER